MQKTTKIQDARAEIILSSDYLEKLSKLKIGLIIKNNSNEPVFIWRNFAGQVGMLITSANNDRKETVLTMLLVNSELDANEDASDIPEFYELEPQQEYQLDFNADLAGFMVADRMSVRFRLIYSLKNELEILDKLKSSNPDNAEAFLLRTQHHLTTEYVNIR